MEKTNAMVSPSFWTDGGDKVLILKRIDKATRQTRNQFTYGPQGSRFECPDWDAAPKCGGGIHGWPWGMGIGEGMDYDIIGDEWVVLAARTEHVVGDLDGGWKCKAKEGDIIYSGPFAGAWAMVNSGRHRLIEAMSKTESSGNSSTAASSGDYSTAASSGYSSTAASSGNYSTAASSGNSSKAASSGNSSTAASSGDSSTAASSGDSGIAASIGSGGMAKAGPNGLLIVCRWVIAEKRYRATVGNVGENGIEADTWYKADANGNLVKA